MAGHGRTFEYKDDREIEAARGTLSWFAIGRLGD